MCLESVRTKAFGIERRTGDPKTPARKVHQES